MNKYMSILLMSEASGVADGGGNGGAAGATADAPPADGQGDNSDSLIPASGTQNQQDEAPVIKDGGENGNEAPAQNQHPFAAFYKDGKLSQSVIDSIGDPADEDNKAIINLLRKYEGAEDPAKALVAGVRSLQYVAGSKLDSILEPLPSDAPESAKAERASLIRKINRAPEKPEGYGLKRPDDLPVSVLWEDGAETKYAEILHKHNASPELAKELMEVHMNTLRGAASSEEKMVQAHKQEQMSALEKEFGASVPKVLDLALRGGLTLGLSKSEVQDFATTAAAVKVLHTVAQKFGEDKLVASPAAADGGAKTNASRADDIMTNSSNPKYQAYRDAKHPDHEATVNEVNNLLRNAYRD